MAVRKTKRTGGGKRKLLKKKGLKKTPRSKEIDHKVPLHKGGSDTLRNVRLISKKSHKRKTKAELRKLRKKKARK